jgi:hypothetical protein
MITFEPESPWETGQHVTFREGERSCVRVVESVEKSVDGNETQYAFVTERVWQARLQGVRPFAELE